MPSSAPSPRSPKVSGSHLRRAGHPGWARREACRESAEGMGAAVPVLQALCSGWAAAAGLLGLLGCWGCSLQGTGARLGELEGGVCLQGEGVGMRLGLLTTLVTSRPGWLV